MEATILGSGPGLPQVDRHLSSILIRREEQLILADCGDGCAQRLLMKHIKANDLDAVFITHYHPDHVSGLFMLIQMLYLMGRTKALPVFLPERPEVLKEMLQTMYTFGRKFKFNLQLLDMEQTNLYYDWIKPTPTDHLWGYADVITELGLPNQMKSWALSFHSSNGVLVYTSDIATTDCIAGILRGAHTVIVDAGHPEADQIVKMKDLNIGQIVLTHGISNDLLARTDELDPDLFDFAREDFVYVV